MKKNFRKFVLTIYLLTLAVVSHALVLKGTASGTVTDIDGRFELKDLKEGNQKPVISYIFYRTAEIDVEVKAENPELNIGLELDGQQLNEVTGKGKPLAERVRKLKMPFSRRYPDSVEWQSQEHLTARKASIPMTSSWQMETRQMQHSGMRPLRILRRSAAG